MMRINNKGFTLVELLAVVILLALVMGFGAVAVTKIMADAKDKDYKLLIANIKSAVELHYQECTYAKNDAINCPGSSGGWYIITLGSLLDSGFIKGNAVGNNDKMILVNTKDGNEIGSCNIRYKYSGNKIEIEDVTNNNSCPTTDDYNS